MERFRPALEGRRDLVVTCEPVPGRGYKGVAMDNVLKLAEQARDSTRDPAALKVTPSGAARDAAGAPRAGALPGGAR